MTDDRPDAQQTRRSPSDDPRDAARRFSRRAVSIAALTAALAAHGAPASAAEFHLVGGVDIDGAVTHAGERHVALRASDGVHLINREAIEQVTVDGPDGPVSGAFLGWSGGYYRLSGESGEVELADVDEPPVEASAPPQPLADNSAPEVSMVSPGATQSAPTVGPGPEIFKSPEILDQGDDVFRVKAQPPALAPQLSAAADPSASGDPLLAALASDAAALDDDLQSPRMTNGDQLSTLSKEGAAALVAPAPPAALRAEFGDAQMSSADVDALARPDRAEQIARPATPRADAAPDETARSSDPSRPEADLASVGRGAGIVAAQPVLPSAMLDRPTDRATSAEKAPPRDVAAQLSPPSSADDADAAMRGMLTNLIFGDGGISDEQSVSSDAATTNGATVGDTAAMRLDTGSAPSDAANEAATENAQAPAQEPSQEPTQEPAKDLAADLATEPVTESASATVGDAATLDPAQASAQALGLAPAVVAAVKPPEPADVGQGLGEGEAQRIDTQASLPSVPASAPTGPLPDAIERLFDVDYRLAVTGEAAGYTPATSCARIIELDAAPGAFVAGRADPAALIVAAPAEIPASVTASLAQAWYDSEGVPATSIDGASAQVAAAVGQPGDRLTRARRVAALEVTDGASVAAMVAGGEADVGLVTAPGGGEGGLLIGFDALAMVAHPDNPTDALTSRDLAGLLGGTVSDWSMIEPTLIGAPTLYLPPESSVSMMQLIDFAGLRRVRPASAVFVPDPAERVRLALADSNGLAFVSLSAIGDARPTPIGRAGSPVAPSLDTLRSGAYPLPTPVYLALADPAAHPFSAPFADFLTSPVGQRSVFEAGLAPVAACDPSTCRLTAPGLEEARARIAAFKAMDALIMERDQAVEGETVASFVFPGGEAATPGALVDEVAEFIRRYGAQAGWRDREAIVAVRRGAGDGPESLRLAEIHAESVALALRCAGVPASRVVVFSEAADDDPQHHVNVTLR